MQPPPRNFDFTIAITALTDGDNLGCSKAVEVAWEKPDATDNATLELHCNCSQHSGTPLTHTTPTSDNTGTHTFTLTHSSTINETGRRIDAIIKNGGMEKNNDFRIDMKAQCPIVPDDAALAARKSKAAAAGSKPIEIDAPDSEKIQLKRGEDKRLKGDFDKAFGRRLVVFVHKVQSGRHILLLVKKVTVFKLFKRWRVKLPAALWKGTDVLNVRLAFVKKSGVIGYAETFPTRVTG